MDTHIKQQQLEQLNPALHKLFFCTLLKLMVF